MESMIGLRSCTFPNQSIRLPSGFHAARATTKSHLSLTHSSLSFPKDARSLSVGYSSSLSLPKSSRSCAFESILGPITCTVDGLLPPHSDNRDDKRAAKAPWTSRFLRKISSGSRSNCKANPDQERVPSKPSPTLLDSYNQILDTIEVLKKHHEYDIAAKLLKMLDDEVQLPDQEFFTKVGLMEMLFLQRKYEEANGYCEKLYSKRQELGPQFRQGNFHALKISILGAMGEMDKAVECMKEYCECQEDGGGPPIEAPSNDS